MAKREFLQLAHKWNFEKYGAASFYSSLKLDGYRCFWDGGTSRGLYKNDVPWANCDRDERFTEPEIATGLWTKYGNVLHAPDWWLDKLPQLMLDGELYGGLTSFQSCGSIVSKLAKNCNPDDWKKVTYYVFGTPPPEVIFATGLMDNKPHFMKVFGPNILPWFLKRFKGLIPKGRTFQSNLGFLRLRITENDVVRILEQKQLPFNTEEAHKMILDGLEAEVARGGEGLVLRKSHSLWLPERCHDLLKVKKRDDAEATITGFTTGKETDRGSKHRGYIGALIVDFEGKRLELSGLDNVERHFTTQEARTWAYDNPGEDVPAWAESVTFKRGMVVTFEYRRLTDDGIPNEAAFKRIRINA